jgi:uncharacterized repeat protein (TIGR03943 family)
VRAPLDARRTGRAVVLAAWAGFFGWLWITGEASRYLGPRTLWILPFGAIALGAALLAQIGTLRSGSGGSALPAGEAAGLLLLLVPILALVVVPRPGLGALAASKKATGAIALGALAVPAPEPGEEIEFIDIHYASRSRDYANEIGVSEGTEVELVGFVTHGPSQPDGTFDLTRFYVSCCAADAVPYSVTVAAPGDDPADDSWLEVSGHLSRQRDRYVVVPERVTARPEPDDPYLFY